MTRSSAAASIVAFALALSACGSPPEKLPETDDRAPAAVAEPLAPQALSLDTLDGFKIVADYHPATADPVATLVLLHQAGSSGGAEYAPLVDTFAAAGFNLLVPDLRSGGDLFGGNNRTAAAFDQEATGYCDAIPDVDAAIARAAEDGLPVFVLGSSYSAALAVRAADVHPDTVAGFIALSPASGEPLAGCDPSAHMAAAPRGFVLRPTSETEIPRVAEQLAAFERAGAKTMVVENGVHGASMLVDERTDHDMTDVRQAVIDFVKERATAL
ncbi:alpha/beta hydrolase [Sphingomicrobium nitratireducens]|uniref:alpha/beta hydrolase n=1 Tax=Sphingomicrobium nitratireducens TaxID=2964666 RepID=UPI00223F4602|nr:alpha/beta fold hydrolase [Sphingomicrobium nitratireducens]